MDRDRTELAARALRLLPTSSTALNRRVVPVRTVPFVNTHVVQWLACGAEIAVFLRHVSELLAITLIDLDCELSRSWGLANPSPFSKMGSTDAQKPETPL